MKLVGVFFVGLVGGFVAFSGFLNWKGISDGEVLAEVVEEVTAVTPSPTLDSTPVRTPGPTPTRTPLATATPTSVPTHTPEPTKIPDPTATPDVWSPPELEPIFAKYAGQYGVDKNILERLANCESHYNPNAVNGDYLGMFQFGSSTWVNYRQRMGLDTNPELRRNAEEDVRTAAYVISVRGTAPWPSCLR